MRRLPPSLGLNWTLNLNFKVGPTFFLSHTFFLSQFFHSHDVYLFVNVFFLFGLCLITTHCCHFADFVVPPYHDTLLPLRFSVVTLPYSLPHLVTMPCFHFALLHVLPCYCCSTFVAILLAFLPCHVVAQPCCFSTFVFFLFV